MANVAFNAEGDSILAIFRPFYYVAATRCHQGTRFADSSHHIANAATAINSSNEYFLRSQFPIQINRIDGRRITEFSTIRFTSIVSSFRQAHTSTVASDATFNSGLAL